MKIVDIILINFNGCKDTFECIDSIKKSDYKYFNIIIIDNKSTDDSTLMITEKYSGDQYNFLTVSFDSNLKEFAINKKNLKEYGNIILIKNDKNGGFGNANNVGTLFSNKYLNSSFIWILNNDTTIEQTTITEMINFSESQKNKGFIGATVLEYYKKNKIQRIAGNKYLPFIGLVIHYNAGKDISQIDKIKANFSYLGGFSIFSTKEIYNQVGGFDERFFLYSEDIDICTTAKKKGIPLYWCKNAVIYHKGGGSIGSKNIIRKSTNFSEYYSDMSMLKYNHKWYPKILASIFGFNRYVLKIVKFLKDKDIDKIKVLNKVYRDFKKGEENYSGKD